MSVGTLEFTARLVGAFRELQPVLAEHKADNFGEALPHVFMADVARFAIRKFAEASGEPGHGRAAAGSVLRRLFAFLETAYEHEGPEIRELIAASFLENLPRCGDGHESGIRDWVGPQMRAQLTVIG